MQALGCILRSCAPSRLLLRSDYGHLPPCLVHHEGLHHLCIYDDNLQLIPDGIYLASLRVLDVTESTLHDIEDHVFMAPSLEVIYLSVYYDDDDDDSCGDLLI